MSLMPAQEDITAWRIGQPDLVIKYPTYKVPARGPDLYGTLDAPFGTAEDRYIKAIQSRVVDGSSRKVVHHALSYAVEPGDNADGATTAVVAAGCSWWSTPPATTQRSIQRTPVCCCRRAGMCG